MAPYGKAELARTRSWYLTSGTGKLQMALPACVITAVQEQFE